MKFLNSKTLTSIFSLLLAFSLFLTGCNLEEEKKSSSSESSSSTQNDKSEEIPSVETETENEQEKEDGKSEESEKEDENKEENNPTSNKSDDNTDSDGIYVTNTKYGKAGFNPNPKAASYGNYTVNQTHNIVKNVFTDALVYTGYNLDKHNASGNRWKYILASQKSAKGWLSKINYGGGCSGYETDSNGLPNIKRFESGGLVCGSYVTYVYFNYLPNVVGIDTSSLTRPTRPYKAHDWYLAALDWVDKGYSELISFKAEKGVGNRIKFTSSKDIPIGSIMVFAESDDLNQKYPEGSHVAIYAGYSNVNGEENHWVTHVGCDNGPEFCAVERMNCDPVEPHWPLAIITPPNFLRIGAAVEVKVIYEDGTPANDVQITIKDNGGKTVKPFTVKPYTLKTDENGIARKEYLNYGNATVSITVPSEASCDNPTQSLKLTAKNNSLTTLTFTIKK